MRSALHVIWFASIATLLFLTGCANAPKPSPLKITLDTHENVNPDLRGRPSPVSVKFFALKSITTFNAGDFFSIFEDEQKALGADLVSAEVFQLTPGEKLQLNRSLPPETRYLGLVAAFRDIERSQWRASLPIPAKEKPSRVLIQLDTNKVQIEAEKRKCLFLC
jgi:type VI secretion system protein VasD